MDSKKEANFFIPRSPRRAILCKFNHIKDLGKRALREFGTGAWPAPGNPSSARVYE
jgi:hypothetical protein